MPAVVCFVNLIPETLKRNHQYILRYLTIWQKRKIATILSLTKS
jgi:hypothetical protein